MPFLVLFFLSLLSPKLKNSASFCLISRLHHHSWFSQLFKHWYVIQTCLGWKWRNMLCNSCVSALSVSQSPLHLEEYLLHVRYVGMWWPLLVICGITVLLYLGRKKTSWDSAYKRCTETHSLILTHATLWNPGTTLTDTFKNMPILYTIVSV